MSRYAPVTNVCLPALGYYAVLFFHSAHFLQGKGSAWGKKECAEFYNTIPQCGFSFRDFWAECCDVEEGRFGVTNPFN